MTPLQFVEKWRPVSLTERSAAQSHFRDLCELFEHPDPVKADPKGEWFTYEKGVVTASGGDGFADVWMRNHFAWEYKKRKRNLDEALGQLARYALALESPPLHIVCDTERFRIVTAWTNMVPKSYDLSLDDLLIPEKRDWLRAAFYDPGQLKPDGTRADLTAAAADKFSSIAASLQARGHGSEAVAHFVSRLVFLFFAEDVRLLPSNYFRRILREMASRSSDATELLDGLFRALQKGNRFGVDRMPHVNGGLFDDQPTLPLEAGDIGLLIAAGSENWAHIDPTIFGTLFERFLDPDKRSQIGAHYTDAAKIMMILEPVLLGPLRTEWETARAEIERLVVQARKKSVRAREWTEAEERRSQFLERLRCLSILDAACGSGNFLYLALQGVKNLEHAANQECEVLGLPPRMPAVGPEILRGIEINPLAAELARTTIWIGDIQWAVQNGIYARSEPILRPLEAIECRDAIMNNDGSEAGWPHADVVIGNPPFLGDKFMRDRLGAKYTENLRATYAGRVPGGADLVCYWFAKGNDFLRDKTVGRVGFVSTNSIRGGANRVVLDRITSEGRIFNAWSDQEWTIEGAAVRVSLICFDNNEPQGNEELDGVVVGKINSNLTAGPLDLTRVIPLSENVSVAFNGISKKGPFNIPGSLARSWLRLPLNPNGRPNSDVILPWLNGEDVTARAADKWIIDFGEMSESEASLYEAPFNHIVQNVKPKRLATGSPAEKRLWWRLARRAPAAFNAIANLTRFIVTPETPTYTVFSWLSGRVVPDKNLVMIARDDDCAFGILQSRFHISWARALGSPYGNHPTARRYNSTRVFRTFPFPHGLTPNISASAYTKTPRAAKVSDAAKRLNELRQAWLNPTDLVKQVPEIVSGFPDRIIAANADAASILKTRTLTNLYNERPTWLVNAHYDLDAAVADAYGWPVDISDEAALAKLLALNLERSSAAKQESPTVAQRAKRSRKSKPLTPEQIRAEPQFKYPIPGGKTDAKQEVLPILEPPQPTKGRKPRRSA